MTAVETPPPEVVEEVRRCPRCGGEPDGRAGVVPELRRRRQLDHRGAAELARAGGARRRAAGDRRRGAHPRAGRARRRLRAGRPAAGGHADGGSHGRADCHSGVHDDPARHRQRDRHAGDRRLARRQGRVDRGPGVLRHPQRRRDACERARPADRPRRHPGVRRLQLARARPLRRLLRPVRQPARRRPGAEGPLRAGGRRVRAPRRAGGADGRGERHAVPSPTVSPSATPDSR